MTVPEARRDPWLRRYPLRRHKVHTAAGVLSFVSPASSAHLLRDAAAAANPGRPRVAGSAPRGAARGRPELPHWADVWPASIGAARHLLRGARLEGQTALDLGCGVGVLGTAAGVHGAHVVFADREPSALRFARFNADRNGIECRRHRQLRYDWNDDRPPDDVDLLLMGDLVYEYRHLLPLARQVEIVVGRGGRALCADPFRPTGADFFARLAGRARVSTAEERVHVDGRHVPLRLVWMLPR